MHLLDHDFAPIARPDIGKTYSDYPFWEYNAQKRSFILTRIDTWSMIQSPAYIIGIGKYKITLPANHYLLIGDIDAGIDFIKMDEMLSREFDVFVFNSDMEPDSWTLQPLKILDYKQEVQVPYPQTKKPVAVSLSETDKRAIMVATVDPYSKMRELSFGDII